MIFDLHAGKINCGSFWAQYCILYGQLKQSPHWKVIISDWATEDIQNRLRQPGEFCSWRVSSGFYFTSEEETVYTCSQWRHTLKAEQKVCFLEKAEMWWIGEIRHILQGFYGVSVICTVICICTFSTIWKWLRKLSGAAPSIPGVGWGGHTIWGITR